MTKPVSAHRTGLAAKYSSSVLVRIEAVHLYQLPTCNKSQGFTVRMLKGLEPRRCFGGRVDLKISSIRYRVRVGCANFQAFKREPFDPSDQLFFIRE